MTRRGTTSAGEEEGAEGEAGKGDHKRTAREGGNFRRRRD